MRFLLLALLLPTVALAQFAPGGWSTTGSSSSSATLTSVTCPPAFTPSAPGDQYALCEDTDNAGVLQPWFWNGSSWTLFAVLPSALVIWDGTGEPALPDACTNGSIMVFNTLLSAAGLWICIDGEFGPAGQILIGGSDPSPVAGSLQIADDDGVFRTVNSTGTVSCVAGGCSVTNSGVSAGRFGTNSNPIAIASLDILADGRVSTATNIATILPNNATNHAFIIGRGTSTLAFVGPCTDGQVCVGDTDDDCACQTITGNVALTKQGTMTLTSLPSGLSLGTWQAQAVVSLADNVSFQGQLLIDSDAAANNVVCSWTAAGTTGGGADSVILRIRDLTADSTVATETLTGLCTDGAATSHTGSFEAAVMEGAHIYALQYAGGGSGCASQPANMVCNIELAVP